MTPAWQTDDIGEEWVESSPSPPTSPADAVPIPTLPPLDQASIRAKRGSLRALGHAVARSLPIRHKNTTPLPRTSSNPFVRTPSGIPSPPTSRSSSEGDEEEREEAKRAEAAGSVAVADTFVVKDGEEDRGKAFPRNPFTPGTKGGKEIFGALALERMFEPPSPPTAEAEGPVEAVPQARSTSPPHPPLAVTPSEPRRASHAYAPANPSRLSKSVTPSSNDSFSSESAASGSRVAARVMMHDETEDDITGLPEHPEDRRLPDETVETGGHADRTARTDATDIAQLKSGEVETDLSPVARADYPFTFNAPADAPLPRRPIRSGVFNPSFEPLANGEPSHSTLHRSTRAGLNSAATSNPALRLFRSTYDTYTREHLSALVDSIAIEASPSPPHSFGSSPRSPPSSSSSRARAQRMRQWSTSEQDEGAAGSRESSETPSSDDRSSKRLRLSPASPKRNSRDWQAQGIALMDRMRIAEMSATSASGSRSSGETASDAHSVDYHDIPPTPPLDAQRFPLPASMVDGPSQLPSGQHRSNPSTASSNYLREAERVMAYIKTRVVSDTASGADASPVVPARAALGDTASSRVNSGSSAQSDELNAKPRLAHSPRRMLRRLSLSEHQKESSESEDEPAVAQTSLDGSLRPSRPTSRTSAASVVGAGLPPSAPIFNPDDLNRFISSSTVATQTTAVSTSFVKHAGAPPRTPGGGMRMIRPGDVQGVVPERIGNMVFDKTRNQWVRGARAEAGQAQPSGPGTMGLDRVDEAGESRAGGSEDSVDVFAGIESLGDEASRAERLGSVRSARSANTTSAISASSVAASIRTTPVTVPRLPREPVDAPPAAASTASGTVRSEPVDAVATPRPTFAHTVSAPELRTPAHAGPSSNPLRSALRNPNSLTPASAIKKRAAWSKDLTPRAGRSVSFSEHGESRDAGHAPEVEPERPGMDKWRAPGRSERVEDDLFSERGEASASFVPSAKTNRIQGLLDHIEDLSLDGPHVTPSKPSKLDAKPNPLAESVGAGVRPAYPPSPTSSDDTVPLPSRSLSRFSRNRLRTGIGGGGTGTGNAYNATFLTECSFGVAHDRLVQLITDVQPFEPYWEQLKTIDLSGRGVETLARLKEFLPVLDEAKLNDNAIDYLSGIPSTVRTLHVAGNRLTSLTSVNHLRNLQYLDISRNQLDSVAQLECLKHLRELKADNNAITDLGGIMVMDCLIKLSVSGNKIQRVDLTNAKWDKLESLNLSHNSIASITALSSLTSLSILNLDANALTALVPAAPMAAVRVLRVSDNDLGELDVALFPKARTVFADGNRLRGLTRSGKAGRIQNLSLRSQRAKGLRLGIEDLRDVKRLYISGNTLLDSFFPSTPLYALTYLEVAACGMQAWPALGRLAPNLRVVNVNYNFFDSLDGLSGLTGLRKVMAVGMQVGNGGLGGLDGLDLEEIDLRMNPATLSFYLPLVLPPRSSQGPSTTDAHVDPADRTATGPDIDPNANWRRLDDAFRAQLPDEWYSRRLAYRGGVMERCARVRVLDGVQVSDGERDKAHRLLALVRAEV
ncbi:Protein nud1 [Cryptotrichosporon argae]